MTQSFVGEEVAQSTGMSGPPGALGSIPKSLQVSALMNYFLLFIFFIFPVLIRYFPNRRM